MQNAQSDSSGDFLVIGGQMDAQGRLIQFLRVQSRYGFNYGIPIQAARSDVLAALKDHFVFQMSPELSRQAAPPARLNLVTVDERVFLRTDQQNLPADFIAGLLS